MMMLRTAWMAVCLTVTFSCLTSGEFSRAEDDPAAVAAIQQAGGSVRKIAANSMDQEVEFYLSDKEVTDDALQYVPKIANVIWLNLRGTKITDAGLVHLKDMKSLKKLHLEKTQIGDAGLQHLTGLENLEYLNVYGTNVSDAGLEHLKKLAKLQRLYVWQSQVTEEGAKKLKESLPNVEIVLGLLPAAPPAEAKPAEAKKE
jgi:hypothetical protein